MSSTGWYSFTVEPSQPAAGELVRIRIDAPDGCFNGDVLPGIDLPTRTIRARVYGDDVVYPECPKPTPYYMPMGPLPQGTYAIEFHACTDGIPPEFPSCTLVETRTLIFGGGDPVEVPDLMPAGAAVLAIALLIAAAITIRR